MSSFEHIADFKQTILATGIALPETIIVDGQIHRYGNKKNCWYVFHEGDISGGAFGCWKTGITQTWCSKQASEFNQAEREEWIKQQAEIAAKVKAETLAKQAEAAKKGIYLWGIARADVDLKHAYLVAKGIYPHGVKQLGQALLIPVYGQDKQLTGCQFIYPTGDKRFITGTKKKGSFHCLKPLNFEQADTHTIYITEGYSTGVSVFMAMQGLVFIAFDKGNLKEVAMFVRSKYPQAKIVICGDNDADGGGQQAAIEAAQAVNGYVALPELKDWNDQQQKDGLEAVKKMIDAAIDSKKAAPSSEESAAPKTQPTKQIVAGSSKHGEGEIETHRNMPKGTPDMLYGLFGEVGLAAAKDTEVNPYAAAMNHMTYFSGCIGRGVYFYIGNTKHHINLFTLHIGRSSHGKKGDAHSLSNRIVDAISQQIITKFGDAGLLPQRHTGGLSSREGLAALIHDGYKMGKDEIAPITDKRLFIKESEFANVIQQSGRSGNTLSPALRDAWDGLGIQPATKHKGMWASNPHIAISGACTPTELLQLTTQNDIGNGFLNRFIIFWAERNNLVPFPKSTPNEVVQRLAEKTQAIIHFAKGNYAWNEDPSLAVEDNRQITLSDKAKKLYGGLYLKELNKSTDGAKVAALMGRNAPYLLRMAALFALSDCALVIEEQHIKAAYAWVQYWHESVKFIFNDAVEEVRNTETSSNADKIMDYLKGRKDHCASKTQISSDVFSRNLSSKNLDLAIHQLLTTTPPKLEVRDGERSDGGTGKKSKLYYLYEFNELYEVTTAARGKVNSYSYEVSPKSTNLGNESKNEQKPNFVNSLNSSELRTDASPTAATNFVKFVPFVEVNSENEFSHDDEFEEGVI